MDATEVAKYRADVPGCANVVHLNNAGHSLTPEPVLDVVIAHLRREAEIGGYEAADEAGSATAAVLESAASLFGGLAEEFAFQTSATQAWWQGINAVNLVAGDRVLASTAEYVSNGIALAQLAGRGVEVEVLADDEHGQVDVAALAEQLDERVKLVVCTHVPTSGGLVNPAEAIGAVVADADALYLLDACQSAGQIDLDLAAIGCDFAAFTGRKYLRAPRGTGLLYVRASSMAGLADPWGMDGVSASWDSEFGYTLNPTAKRYEAFESSAAARLGLGAALDYALDIGMPRIEARVAELAATARTALADLDGVEVRDRGVKKCGLVTFTVDGHEPADVVASLRERGINTSASNAPSSQFDLGRRGIPSVVRASIHYYNTTDEIDRLIDEVRSL